MPYKDKNKQLAYRKAWRIKNKELNQACQKVYNLQHKLKKLEKKGIDESNKDIFDQISASISEAKSKQQEIISIAAQNKSLEQKLNKKQIIEEQRKQLISLKEEQELLAQQEHNERILQKEKLLQEREIMRKELLHKEKTKYSNSQLYHFKKKRNIKSYPTTEQILANHKLDISKKNHKQRMKAMEFIWNYKTLHCCKHCEENHPAVLCFHHRDPSEKEYEIGRLVTRGRSLEIIKKELEKCDVLCMNCHTLYHWKERFSLMG